MKDNSCPRCRGFLMINKRVKMPGISGYAILTIECPVCKGTGITIPEKEYLLAGDGI